MKTKLFLLLALPLLFLAACSGGSASETTDETNEEANATTESVTYSVDPAATSVEWVGKKVTGQHNGTIQLTGGSVSVENGEVVAGNFTVDMTTIGVSDLTDPEMNGKLLGHLKSPDFFNVDSFPEAKFVISKVEHNTGDPNGRSHIVTGNLTIKDITKGITVFADINVADPTLTIKSDFDIDRTEWDVKYGSGKFFEGLGDKMIDDLFTMAVKLSAKKENS